MTGPMTSMTPTARAWRREQMQRSNDIEGLTPLDAEDQAFVDALFSVEMTTEEQIAAVHDHVQSRIKGRAGRLMAKAS